MSCAMTKTNGLSSPAQEGDPVNTAAGDLSAPVAFTGCPACAGHDETVFGWIAARAEHFPEKWAPVFRRKCDQIKDFLRDPRGVSAVEFALLLPLMLTLYITGTEISQAVAIDLKVTLTARTVADLVSRVTTTTTTDVKNSLSAATAVISPYASSQLTVTVSQVKIDANGNATIDWSCSFQGTARAKDSPVTLPASLVTPNSYLIWGEGQYNYTPPIGYVISGTLNLKDQIYMAPRLSYNVGFNPATCPTFP